MSLFGRRPRAVYTVCDADAALGAESLEAEGAHAGAGVSWAEDPGHDLAGREHTPAAGREHARGDSQAEGELPGRGEKSAAPRAVEALWRTTEPGAGEPPELASERHARLLGAGAARAAAILLLLTAAGAVACLAGSLGHRGLSAAGRSHLPRDARRAGRQRGPGATSAAAASRMAGRASGAAGKASAAAGRSSRADARSAGSWARVPARRAALRPDGRSGERSPQPRRAAIRRVVQPPGIAGRAPAVHADSSLGAGPQPPLDVPGVLAESDPTQPAPAGAGPPNHGCRPASCQQMAATAEFGFER